MVLIIYCHDFLAQSVAKAWRTGNACNSSRGLPEVRQLAGVRRSDLAAQHGMGAKILGTIEAALKEHGFNLS